MKRLFIVALSIIAITQAGATGYYGSSTYLDEGGRNVDASPEFYWDLELKRIAQEFRAPEARVRPEGTGTVAELTASVDRSDFEDALRQGRIKPTEADEARKAHAAAREAIVSLGTPHARELPQEFGSEFADYHRGAFAYQKGGEHFDEARDAWLALLKRPPEERHYRTVWAAFMLGKLALKTNINEAAQWFQQTREFAKQGFADSLGCAADSYGWEGRAELKQDHPEAAAKLFLTQLHLGDESAVVSIKALIPDRQPVPGMLNYNVVESDNEDDLYDPKKKLGNEQELAGLQRAAKDPLLRRLVTAHILATGSTRGYFAEERNAAQARARRWLEVIKGVNLSRVADAEYLGWIAYLRGDYKDAGHWLDLSPRNTPAALWLKAKVARRKGNIGEAVSAMAEAWQLLRDERTYTGWAGASRIAEYFGEESGYVYRGESPSWSLSQQASGDLGAFKLQRADFVQALDILVKGDVWNDAAYVAERVLTTTELKRYVDELPATTPLPRPSVPPIVFGWQKEMPMPTRLRYLLGRRLVREDRYDDAMHYLQPPFDQMLRRYVDALHAGANQGLSKNERALALFRAAWIARYDGMELMGTEMAPDGFTEEGNFPVPDLAKQRITGKAESNSYDDAPKVVPAVLRATRQEIQRLAATKPSPDIRFHYRVIAAAIAMRAAALLPDNSEEAADVINIAGRWVKEQDEKLANKYFGLLERRAAGTPIGRAAIDRRWFVEMKGPWSTKMDTEEKQLKRELGLHEPFEEDPQPQQSPHGTPSGE